MNKKILTFDMDWASEEEIDYLYSAIMKANIKTTWFLTHSSAIIRDIIADKKVNIGVHPNFLQNSSHGDDEVSVLNYFSYIDSKIIRSHHMLSSHHHLSLYRKYGYTIDSSLYMHMVENLAPYKYTTDSGDISRYPVFLIDDMIIRTKMDYPIDEIVMKSGLQVYCFHPTHIYNNRKIRLLFFQLLAFVETWEDMDALL